MISIKMGTSASPVHWLYMLMMTHKTMMISAASAGILALGIEGIMVPRAMDEAYDRYTLARSPSVPMAEDIQKPADRPAQTQASAGKGTKRPVS